jgi:rod shape-determining protein MreC
LGFLQTSLKNKGQISPVDNVVRLVQSPVANLTSLIAERASGLVRGAMSGDALKYENEKLKRQLNSMLLYTERESRLEAEINNLRSLNGLDKTYQREKIITDITGYFPASHTLKIAAGASRGVKEGMPVVSSEGLIGRVQAVSKSESQVILVTSSAFLIGAIATAHNPPPAGLLKGENAPTLVLTLQSSESSIGSADMIYTTGFSPLIPRGIAIGRVLSVEKLAEIGTTRARVLPVASVGNLREVVVLK